MKSVTKNNLLKLIEMKKEYYLLKEKNENEEKRNSLKKEINKYIDEVINKDSEYYKKLSSYNFNNEELKYLI